MKKDNMKKARRKTKRKRIKKIQSVDFWIGDGRHAPVTGVTPNNIRKRSSRPCDERKTPLQRVTTVTHLWRPSRAWRRTLRIIEDVGVKGRIILPVSTEPPILLPQLLLLLEFLHEDFIKNSKLNCWFFLLYIWVPRHSPRVEEFYSEQTFILFYSYF